MRGAAGRRGMLSAMPSPDLAGLSQPDRAGDRPSLGFWLAGLAGSGLVIGYAMIRGAGIPQPADGLLLLAMIAAALGYAEGGRLAQFMGGWQVICWALVFAAPLLALPDA